jgi:CelD/BcsL family acetyltransferase involved in cellulose biosynthesis
MSGSVDPIWVVRPEDLPFQFGPFRLGTVKFTALSLLSNPFVVDPDLEVLLQAARDNSCRSVVRYGMPIGQPFATMSFDHGMLRYALRYGDRYLVDLQGSFDQYLRKFSKKSRGNLRRSVKKFAQANGGTPDIREYRSPSEIRLFRDIAVAISHASYKSETGWGFREDASFARELEHEAEAGRVRGYVLMSDDQPAAYVFCRIDHDVIIYKHIGYNETFASSSPGTALLYLMLERLFDQNEFRLLDFDGLEYYAYKEFFSTHAVQCARVVWFQPRIREIVVFGAHWALTSAWRFASALRDRLRPNGRKWMSARRWAGLHSG